MIIGYGVVAFRDPNGIRPLCYGQRETEDGVETLIASESVALDALDFKNTNLLRTFVTDQGRILPRKYTGLPAHYQRRLNSAIKRARQMLLMK